MSDMNAAGTMAGIEHRLPARVYYVDTDAGGIVYHATYLAFAERGRTEMLRMIGVDLLALKEEKHLVFAVRRCDMDFLRPARLDDLLDVRTRMLAMGGATLDVIQSVYRQDEELVRIRVQLACMRLDARAARIPAAVRGIVQDYVKETD